MFIATSLYKVGQATTKLSKNVLNWIKAC